MRLMLTPLLLVSLLAGCAKYNFDLLQPESSHARITSDDWQRVDAGPLSYRFRAVENHLVVQIYNSTPDPIRILGDRSYVVTPANQSVPIPSQSIAPGSFVKLILPPVVQQITRPGPSIGIGFGYSTGRANPADQPPYFSSPFPEQHYLYVDSVNPYWEWEGETNITLHLVFEQADKPFDQSFVIHRVKT